MAITLKRSARSGAELSHRLEFYSVRFTSIKKSKFRKTMI